MNHTKSFDTVEMSVGRGQFQIVLATEGGNPNVVFRDGRPCLLEAQPNLGIPHRRFRGSRKNVNSGAELVESPYVLVGVARIEHAEPKFPKNGDRNENRGEAGDPCGGITNRIQDGDGLIGVEGDRFTSHACPPVRTLPQ